MLTNPSPSLWYSKLLDVAIAYPSQLARMFFVLPVVAAVIGACLVRSRAIAVLSSMLVLVTLGALAFMRVGGQQALGNIPRSCTRRIQRSTCSRRSCSPGWPPCAAGTASADCASWAPWLFIALVVVLNNIDAFGYPSLYYEAVHNGPPAFVP